MVNNRLGMNKSIGIFGSLFMATAVILGAFGAHFLKIVLSANQLNTFQTGVEYQFIHGLGLLFLGIIGDANFHKFFRWAGILMVIGISLFSGSLYLLSIQEWLNFNVSFLGPVTPLGGLAFILSWLFVLLGFTKQ